MKHEGKRSEQPLEEPTRLRRLMRSPWVYRSMFVVAGVIVIQHLLAHAGWRPLSLSMGAQDILIGYPTALLVGVAGLYLWGRDPVGR